MVTRKPILTVLLFIICSPTFFLQLSNGAVPDYYKEKRIFYDSLSIVLNKYIVPVDNWRLFTGTLQGLQTMLGKDEFHLNPGEYQVQLKIKDKASFVFSRDVIDVNAIELIESLSKIFDLVFTHFKDNDKTIIIHAAIKGMVTTLDPNSYFIAAEDLERLKAQNKGFYQGIGLEITSRKGVLTVVSPYEDTPAFRQGIRPGDRILAVDSLSTKDLHLMDVSEKIRGETGKAVTLTIDRNGWNHPRSITMIREAISHKTVRAIELEPGFGYIRIMNFLGTTDDDFAACLQNLDESLPLKGLILDLRFNPGGLLNQSLSIADFFLDTGIIASTEGRIKSDNKVYYARPGSLHPDYPIVVLINGGSASGSEIVAATLRSHERAVLVGEKTFGKGYIQTIFSLQTGAAIRLTTSMLMTPDGNKIQDIGIEPDLYFTGSSSGSETSGIQGEEGIPVLAEEAKTDPAVLLGLNVLKRALLLQQVPENELEGLSPQQIILKKLFRGLNKAIQETAAQNDLQTLRRLDSSPEPNTPQPTSQ